MYLPDSPGAFISLLQLEQQEEEKHVSPISVEIQNKSDFSVFIYWPFSPMDLQELYFKLLTKYLINQQVVNAAHRHIRVSKRLKLCSFFLCSSQFWP